MKKIAVITSRFPIPLNKGDKLRIFYHIKELSQIAEVYLICLHDKEPSSEEWNQLNPYCKKVYSFEMPASRSRRYAILNFLKGMPLQVGYFFDPYIKRKISSILEDLNPDHIHCHLVRMVPYVSHYPECSKSLDYMDSLVLNDMAGQHLSRFPFSLLKNVERKRIQLFERKVHEYFQSHFVISDRDRSHFKNDIRQSLKLLPNGVARQDYIPDTQRKYDICFCGNLGYLPNLQAVNFLINEILPHLENLTCVIAGAEAPDYLKQLRRHNLQVMSPVSDMTAIYLRSKLQVAPIFNGSGQQNKILEAMSLGVANVTTSFVNESIGAKEDEEIMICSGKDDFIKTINTLISRPEIRDQIAISANKFVQRNFDWTVNSRTLLHVIEADK